MSKKMLIILLLIIMLPLFSCKKEKYYEKKCVIFAFDTTIDIRLGSSTLSELELENHVNEITNIFTNYSRLSDNYQEYSDIINIYSINHSNNYVTVSDELLDLIWYSIDRKSETNKLFNPFIGNITQIYKDIIENKTLPDNLEELISKEEENLSNAFLGIRGNDIMLEGNTSIDLGAIAKGYALGIVKNYLIENEITDYLVNAGASSILMGTKNSNNGYYKVGLKYDLNSVLKIKNKCLGTSSIKEQNVEIDGKLYHHIINPFTGYPTENYDTVYLIGDDPGKIDAYVTAIFSMTLDEVEEFLSDLDYDCIIYKDDKIIYSNNSGDYFG